MSTGSIPFPFLTYKRRVKALQKLIAECKADSDRLLKEALNAPIGNIKRKEEVELEGYLMSHVQLQLELCLTKIRQEVQPNGEITQMYERDRESLKKYGEHI